jgi:serine/threonine protein kinase
MGQVFRATDTRLARNVAIKISHEKFTERFEREARTSAALNHPYICTLHDVGPNYLVMELVEGETIAARLKRGSLSIDDTLRYGAQIAEALAAAHARGITHRDLKPANVMVTKSAVKVLDFGLAKSSRDDSLTASNVAMGTPAYMAPEQLEAKDCDARTDLYALGLLLFEMATGKRAPQGTPPQLDSLPERLAHVVELCLAKDPDQRWQDALDVKHELEWAAIGSAPVEHSGSSSRVWLVVSGLSILLLFTLALVHFREAAPQQAVVHSTILPPDTTSFSFATNLGPMSLSPDGKRMVFAATRQDGKSQLWIRPLDSATAQPLQGTDRGAFPFWSPDGLWVAFFADGKLKKIDTRGGTPVALAQASASNGYGGSWSAKGEIVFAATSFAPLLKISQEGGKASLAVEYTGARGFPWFLPDGEHFLFAAWGGSGRMTIRVGSLSSTDSAAIGAADSNAIYAGGRLLYLSGTSLMAQPFDLKSLRMSGAAEPIAEGVQRFLDLVSVGAFSASTSGLLAYQTGSAGGRKQLSWFDRTGKPIKTLGDPRAFFSIELSPDGRNLVASASDTLGNYDLWLFDVARGLPTRFTSDPGGEYYGVWSPDGLSVILNSTRKGHYDLFRGANNAGSEEVLYADDTNKVPTSWSPNGKHLLYFTGGGPRHEIFVLPLTPARPGEPLKSEPFLKTGFNELFGQFSPDGRWVVYSSDLSGQSEIYVTPFSRPSERRQISMNGGGRPRWRRDGKELYYIALDGKLMATETRISEKSVDAGPTHALLTIAGSSPASTAGYPFEVSPDGQRILTLIPAGDGTTQPVTLVQNWTGALKK